MIIRGLVLLFLMIGLLLYINYSRPTEINNTMPADQIITINHGLKKALLAEAIFYVRKGFEDVTATKLSKEVGLKLECKRQVTENEFYYVVKGDGYRCFILTNSVDVVQEVLVIRDFLTIEKMKQLVDNYGYSTDIADTPELEVRKLWRDIGSSSVYRNTLFTLQNGVMIMQSIGEIADPQFFYFTDEEWATVYHDWDGFMILPIDKQPW